jgi:hypothetical protein
MTPANAWAAGTAHAAGAVSAVGTVVSVRVADSTLVVNRAYRFRDSRPRTVKVSLTPGTAVVVNGSPGSLGTVRAGMQVTVTGNQVGSGVAATRVVARR